MSALRRTYLLGVAVMLLHIVACTEDTSELGISLDQDKIDNGYESYEVTTKSSLLGSVLYTSPYSYVGNVIDPETGSNIGAAFAAQFHTFEDYKFPDREMLLQATGTTQPEVDSVEVRLYFDNYYGDMNNPMKLEVFRLSSTKFLEENVDYATDTDLSEYVDFESGPLASKMFTVRDYNVSDNEMSESGYNQNIRICLPCEAGNRILADYYDNPSNFKDSYTFIRNVFPGLYFRIRSGSGTMVRVKVGTLNLYFRYMEEGEEEPSEGICRFAATPEVIQTTEFDNNDLSSLMSDNTCTYLKTPAGICTEMTLPVDEVFANHANDSISLAKVSLTRYNNVNENDYSLGIPDYVLMVRKADATTFFKNRSVANGQTSFTASFSSADNTYSFANIGRLLTYCHYEKLKGMREQGLTSEEWNSQHPDWNKVLIIPVDVSYTTDSYGNVSQVSVTHNLELNSVRLVGGDNALYPIKMQVIYSNFN